MRVAGLVAVGASALTFGPKDCVSVYKSEETKSCVLETNCAADANLSEVEFAFTCKLDSMVQKHSFGKGGFDAQEKFDTSVKCNSCGLPDEVGLSLKKTHHNEKKEESAEAKADSTTVTKYGPSDCFSTWLSADETANEDGEKGTCVVQSACKDVSGFADYPVGLICMDKDKTPVRHLFGSNSFDPEEQFNTMVRCTECLGMDEVSENVTLEAQMKGLSSVLTHVAAEVDEMNGEVGKLDKEVEKDEAATEQTGFLIKKHDQKEQQKAEEEQEKVADQNAEAAEAGTSADQQQTTVVEDVYDDDA